MDENRKATNDLMAKEGDGDLNRAIATCSKYMEGCFAAGTMLRTPSGLKAIEEFGPGDEVLSQDEHDPRSGIVARKVEEVFRRYAPVLGVHLRREGEGSPLVVRSTSEHPFYVSDPVYLGRWVAAGELQAGQWVLCDDGAWARVEEVHDSGEWEVVYNMRVADSHTYFVGEAGRGYAVWVHNAYFTPEAQTMGGPYQGRWLLRDQTQGNTNGLLYLNAHGRPIAFDSLDAARAESERLNQTRSDQSRLNTYPTTRTRDRAMERATDTIHSAIQQTLGSAIVDIEHLYTYAPTGLYPGQPITDVDILLNTVLVEVKNDGAGSQEIEEKILAFSRLFDPVQCLTPIPARPMVIYCEGMRADRLRQIQSQVATGLAASGIEHWHIVNSLPDLVALVS